MERLGVGAAFLVCAGLLAYVWPFMVDDAFITLRVGANLWRGDGYAFNPGVRADAVTGPLWVVPAVAAAALGAPWLPKAIGACCYLASLGVVSRAERGAWCAFTLALSASGAAWAVGGLETGAATLAVALILRGGRAAPLAAACIPWLRPELVPAAFAFTMVGEARGRRSRWLGLGLGLAGVAVFRIALFGTPFPLSASAKHGTLLQGAEYALYGALLLGLIFLWPAVQGARKRPWLGVGLALHGAALTLAGGDWMPAFRLWVPVLPAFAIAAGLGLGRHRRYLGLAHAGAAAAVVLMLLPDARGSADSRESAGAQLASLLRGGDGPVALVDVGYIAYASEREILDLGGITERAVARMAGNHVDRRIDIAYLETRRPRDVVLHSITEPVVEDARLVQLHGFPSENRLARSDWLASNYRVERVVRYAPAYWYVWLTRITPADR